MAGWRRYAALLALVLTIVSLFGLAASSADTKLFERWFPALILINKVIVVVLAAVVISMLVRLYQRLHRKEFGAQMTWQLGAWMFALAIVPGLLIYFMSTIFISRSIDSWFDVRVEGALDSGVEITRGILTEQQRQTELTAKHMADMLENTPASLVLTDLMQLMEGHNNMEALVFTGNGTAVAAAGTRLNVLLPDLPTPLQMQAVRSAGLYSVIDDGQLDSPDAAAGGAPLSIRVIVPIGGPREPDDQENGASSLAPRGLAGPSAFEQRPTLYLQVIEAVSTETSRRAAVLLQGFRDYQTLILTRASLQEIYMSTLMLVMCLAAFGAVVGALSIARRTTEPVMQLEQGTRRVADGNFEPIREFSGKSEINVLTQSFNSMIRDVAESRRGIEAQRMKAEQAQAYLERVLSNISSGVLVLDSKYRVLLPNAAAKRILGESICTDGACLTDVLPTLADAVKKSRMPLDISAQTTVGFEFELNKDSSSESIGGNDGVKTVPLFIKMSIMPLRSGESGLVVVFDDVTQLMEAQRTTAWGEVARRLAHEIKNPLTPIRLTAERLELRLEDRLSNPEDAAMLHRAISTIITQVDALKQMVNDFREYAKIPQAKLSALSLNDFLKDVAALYDEADVPLTLRLAPNLPEIQADASQLRQVLHNLLSNSLDASEGQTPKITIETQLAQGADGARGVRLTITDAGCGFPEHILAKAFEPYVTTKETGTGLGLPMVKRIIDEHHGSIHIANRMDKSGCLVLGAQIDILFTVLAGTAAASH